MAEKDRLHSGTSPHQNPAGKERSQAPPVDAELDVRSIVAFAVGLGVVIAVVLGVVWMLNGALKTNRKAHDPRPSPLPEANMATMPPEPRLQTDPNRDMKALRDEEDAVLTAYAWVDKERGIARIPIERAMEIVALSGLRETITDPAAKGAASSSVQSPSQSPAAKRALAHASRPMGRSADPARTIVSNHDANDPRPAGRARGSEREVPRSKTEVEARASKATATSWKQIERSRKGSRGSREEDR